jgi:hypothetical protein
MSPFSRDISFNDIDVGATTANVSSRASVTLFSSQCAPAAIAAKMSLQ